MSNVEDLKLYVALFKKPDTKEKRVEEEEDRYHWTFIIGPQITPTFGDGSSHSKNFNPTTWQAFWKVNKAGKCNIPSNGPLVPFTIIRVADVKHYARLTKKIRPSCLSAMFQQQCNCKRRVQKLWGKLWDDDRLLNTTPSPRHELPGWDEVQRATMGCIAAKRENERYDHHQKSELIMPAIKDLVNQNCIFYWESQR
ncbi:hypothetical protein BDV28DRAFT_145008 [Aspergillus coremiiformis]|uniref:Uncharacterized protein n=1 Tax=Aspergillus coremiiformis TaxID=138285 RepID=A0A5N6ZG95_9EURO|nr:hypothetical protein BDV28DRAFT_145008 [Aspergillus coremiiformis]